MINKIATVIFIAFCVPVFIIMGIISWPVIAGGFILGKINRISDSVRFTILILVELLWLIELILLLTSRG